MGLIGADMQRTVYPCPSINGIAWARVHDVKVHVSAPDTVIRCLLHCKSQKDGRLVTKGVGHVHGTAYAFCRAYRETGRHLWWIFLSSSDIKWCPLRFQALCEKYRFSIETVKCSACLSKGWIRSYGFAHFIVAKPDFLGSWFDSKSEDAISCIYPFCICNNLI